MTQLLGIYDKGRAGGTWLAYTCNKHPAGMRIIGEAHVLLGFAYPCPVPEYEDHTIKYLQSQIDQGIAVTGIIKCFWNRTRAFIEDHGGRFITLIRNPMELVGFRTSKEVFYKKDMDRRFLKRPARNKEDWLRAHVLYYKATYHSLPGPIVRIEDLNRSCGSDGSFFQGVMEYITQVPWPMDYIQHIQKHYLPGYLHRRIKTQSYTSYFYEGARMSWADDLGPANYWETWTVAERKIFTEGLGPTCDRLGYNYRGRPGFTDLVWSYGHKYPWSKMRGTLKPILPTYDGPKVRRGIPKKANLPIFKGVSNA